MDEEQRERSLRPEQIEGVFTLALEGGIDDAVLLSVARCELLNT